MKLKSDLREFINKIIIIKEPTWHLNSKNRKKKQI